MLAAIYQIIGINILVLKEYAPLPIFKRYHAGCINWGLVSGKTQTIYHWGSKQSTAPPVEWFHDLFYPDGRPYRQAEVDTFRKLTER